ncbi:sugar phosphate nucleotidyltransferase [Clostridium boliviensis]|uniref:Glucose-1-phosphate thymidylyltransferase n=1 Tax=Clostridium boliviensis TaxID=318465 RepID=A0ABU4GQP7_9CLOT|nr:sugar phosphate nucleotidyltransferase [Clostridium boliviensis]MDW2799936.1 sugar phosphate nucleotidyltransferase [Clostridium boliviensis]
MKGVILAGGNGKRMYPLTVVTNKHLLPIYKKPMIFYPIETLVKAGVKEILIVTSGEYIGDFYRLLHNGKEWGVNFHYEIQEGNTGTGAALLCAEDFVKDDDFIVILGDNIVTEDVKPYTENFKEQKNEYKAKILIAKVNNPENYGVVEFDDNKIIKLVEKPERPATNYVNTGLWIFQSEVFSLLKNLKISRRNEYEATDVLNFYAKQGKLSYGIIQSKWTDAGTFEQLYNATVQMKELESKKSK